MMKSFWLVMVLMIVAVGGFQKGVEASGACGKFSTDRMLTHVFRHCVKPARDVSAPVSAQCCNSLVDVPIACYYAIIFSDAFEKLGIDRKIAYTIPQRCAHTYHHH
ncbi:alpha-amylase inhibitor/lipid transfer/seed storage family protein precursor [Senna tora]|uniref:Alpha-amylase inhibitor/lipid transfer/seed storage family protein n=1 Tax=Senna tora TaxID=362788 RepID=A0A834WBI8_9FABA|nr:alpha-amylase inhibitor/lipid transfer/seed storage family protein precursor [Senna tora]